MPWSANVLPSAPMASANLSGATGWPAAAQISPLLCMVGRGSTAICMMPGISADRLLPEMAYLIATFFTPEGRHWATFGTAEDGSERLGLLLIGALINVGCKRPVALSHLDDPGRTSRPNRR